MNIKSLSKNIKDKVNFKEIAKQATINYKDSKGPTTVIIKNSNKYENDYLDFIYNLYNFKYQNGNFGWRYVNREIADIIKTYHLNYSTEKKYNNMKQLSKNLKTNFKYKNGNFNLHYITETRLVNSSLGRIKKNIKDLIIKYNKYNLKELPFLNFNFYLSLPKN